MEQLDRDTVLAFANGQHGLLIIKTTVKRRLIQYSKKKAYPTKELVPIVFAICVYLLVRNLSKYSVLEIDEEYSGYEELIRKSLKKLLDNKFEGQWEDSIRFVRIGKVSPAHLLCWSVHRMKRRPESYKKIAFEDIVKFL